MADPVVWQRAILLDSYYNKIGLSAVGDGECPRFTTFKAGYGLLDFTGVVNPEDPPVIMAIPRNLTEIPDPFYEGDIEGEFIEGKVALSGVIPSDGVSVAKQFSVIGLYDQAGDLIAVSVSLPDWVTPGETYKVFPMIVFPVEENE